MAHLSQPAISLKDWEGAGAAAAERALLRAGFDAESVRRALGSARASTHAAEDLTEEQLREACGFLNEHFRNTKRDESAAVLLVSPKCAAVPKQLDLIIIPAADARGVWTVFAYEVKERMLFVSNKDADYDAVEKVVQLLQQYDGSEEGACGDADGRANGHIEDVQSLNASTAVNSVASSIVLIIALLKTWNEAHTLRGCDAGLRRFAHVDDAEESQRARSFPWNGRLLTYNEALPVVLRMALSAPDAAHEFAPDAPLPAPRKEFRYNAVFALI